MSSFPNFFASFGSHFFHRLEQPKNSTKRIERLEFLESQHRQSLLPEPYLIFETFHSKS